MCEPVLAAEESSSPSGVIDPKIHAIANRRSDGFRFGLGKGRGGEEMEEKLLHEKDED
jgi:hypothetical protein